MNAYKVTFEIHDHDENEKYLGIVETRVMNFYIDTMVDVYGVGESTDNIKRMRLSEIQKVLEYAGKDAGICLRPYKNTEGNTRFHRITKIDIEYGKASKK